MNCEWLKAASAYDCTPVTSLHGEPGLEIGTPFSYADGTAIVLYAIRHGEQVMLSDNGDALAHLSSMGLHITRHRVSKLRDRLSAFGMTLDAAGDVRALVPLQQGPHALAQAVSGLLAVAEWEREQLGLDENVADLADAAEVYLRDWSCFCIYTYVEFTHAAAKASGKGRRIDVQPGRPGSAQRQCVAPPSRPDAASHAPGSPAADRSQVIGYPRRD